MAPEPQTLLSWAIENGAVLVFAVRRADGQGWGGNGGEWRLAEVAGTAELTPVTLKPD